jgi:Holliday junction resolvasome RuvABC endonuclease subunit
MTYVSAIDPACGATGHLAWRDGEIIACKTIKTPTSMMDQQRWDVIANAVFPDDASIWGEPALIMIEQPYGQSISGQTVLLNGGLFAVITHQLWQAGVPFVIVQPSQLKQYATGMGDANKKREVVPAIRERYAGILPPLRTEDECDAAAMLAMALDYYGRPLCTVPDKNREVLYAKYTGKHKLAGQHKIQWPDWTMTGD